MGERRSVSKEIEGNVVSIDKEPVDEAFMAHFKKDVDNINAFVNEKIGHLQQTIRTQDCFFGSAAFSDMIHDLQLALTSADVSFNAPLGFNTRVDSGDVHVSDLFKLYKYENKIYVLRMTGREIRKHLEMSYALWTNQMLSPKDHLILLEDANKEDMQRYGFKNLTFNFDSASGIDYEVDVTKPAGEKVRILRMSNGKPFDESKWYKVAMNSYRGNGGGELLTKGAGIPLEKIKERIVYKSPKDLRFYLMERIKQQDLFAPKAHLNWKFMPEAWTNNSTNILNNKKLYFN